MGSFLRSTDNKLCPPRGVRGDVPTSHFRPVSRSSTSKEIEESHQHAQNPRCSRTIIRQVFLSSVDTARLIGQAGRPSNAGQPTRSCRLGDRIGSAVMIPTGTFPTWRSCLVMSVHRVPRQSGSDPETSTCPSLTHSRRPAVLKYYRWFRSSKLPQG